ncbi:Na+/H+ antiporter subunit G, partial [Candidatus Aerophobetes bacterium]
FILVFVLITTPVASHIIAQAAYESGVEPWRKPLDNFRKKKR